MAVGVSWQTLQSLTTALGKVPEFTWTSLCSRENKDLSINSLHSIHAEQWSRAGDIKLGPQGGSSKRKRAQQGLAGIVDSEEGKLCRQAILTFQLQHLTCLAQCSVGWKFLTAESRKHGGFLSNRFVFMFQNSEGGNIFATLAVPSAVP